MKNNISSASSLVEPYDTAGKNSANDASLSAVESPTISAKDLQMFLHDLNGPLASARGFTEELLDVQRNMKELIENPNLGADSALMTSLQEQIDEEMQFCLDRVERSLKDLDAVVESVRERARDYS